MWFCDLSDLCDLCDFCDICNFCDISDFCDLSDLCDFCDICNFCDICDFSTSATYVTFVSFVTYVCMGVQAWQTSYLRLHAHMLDLSHSGCISHFPRSSRFKLSDCQNLFLARLSQAILSCSCNLPDLPSWRSVCMAKCGRRWSRHSKPGAKFPVLLHFEMRLRFWKRGPRDSSKASCSKVTSIPKQMGIQSIQRETCFFSKKNT